jgi:hypothetical protein
VVQAAASRLSADTPFDMLLRHAANVIVYTDQIVQRSNPPLRAR